MISPDVHPSQPHKTRRNPKLERMSALTKVRMNPLRLAEMRLVCLRISEVGLDDRCWPLEDVRSSLPRSSAIAKSSTSTTRIASARYDSVMSTPALQPDVASYDRISIGMLMGGLFLPLAAAGISPGTASQALSFVALLCWLLLPVWYPFFAIRTGVIGGRYRVFKRQDPVKFWLGLATYEALLLMLSFCIASVLYSTLEKT